MPIEGLLKRDRARSARLAAAGERINPALADAVERYATKDKRMRGTLKRASVVCYPESEPQKRIALDTEQDSTPRLQSHTEDPQHQARNPASPQALTWSGPAPDVTRASGEDRAGGDVVMREDENDRGHPSSTGPDSRRRITTRREPREVRDELSSTTEQHVPKRIFLKTAPQERAVAVTTHEALDGSREKAIRIANVENNALMWVSISSARALDMTHCDFSARSARDEMRHIIGSSEPDVIIGSDKDQNQVFEAQVARGRYFVHGLTPDVNSRTNEVHDERSWPCLERERQWRIYACLDWPHAMKEDHCQRNCTDSHQRETSWNEDAKQMHRHASTRSCRRGQHNRGRETD